MAQQEARLPEEQELNSQEQEGIQHRRPQQYRENGIRASRWKRTKIDGTLRFGGFGGWAPRFHHYRLTFHRCPSSKKKPSCWTAFDDNNCAPVRRATKKFSHLFP
eukprot:EG_transcript_26191